VVGRHDIEYGRARWRLARGSVVLGWGGGGEIERGRGRGRGGAGGRREDERGRTRLVRSHARPLGGEVVSPLGGGEVVKTHPTPSMAGARGGAWGGGAAGNNYFAER